VIRAAARIAESRFAEAERDAAAAGVSARLRAGDPGPVRSAAVERYHAWRAQFPKGIVRLESGYN
jgi:hypothetical protein